jgi:hypothetical protein
MLEKQYTTIKLKLRSPQGKIVDGIVIVRDGQAVVNLSDVQLTKQLCEAERKAGADVFYNSSRNLFIREYPKMKKDEIVDKLVKEMKKIGAVSRVC